MAVVLAIGIIANNAITVANAKSIASAITTVDASTQTPVISNEQSLEFDVNSFDYNKQIADAGLQDLDPTDFGASKDAKLQTWRIWDETTQLYKDSFVAKIDGKDVYVGTLRITIKTYSTTATWMEWFLHNVCNTITTFQSMTVELTPNDEVDKWSSDYSVNAYAWVDSRAGNEGGDQNDTFKGADAVNISNTSTAPAKIENAKNTSTTPGVTTSVTVNVDKIKDTGTQGGTSHGADAKWIFFVYKDGVDLGLGHYSNLHEIFQEW